MIVTADPVGDFNATSQILRYSALAREITVPRIPSVTSTILAGSASSGYFGGRGRMSPTETERETMEIAALEIARMSEEIDGLRSELAAEQERRMEVEAHLESLAASTEDKLLEMEAEVREECYQEMERRVEGEMRKWKATWAAENDRNDEHMDKKIEIFTRTIDVFDDEDKENEAAHTNENLEEENTRLRREVELLRRDLQQRSPTKKNVPLREISGMGRQMESLRISGENNSTPGLKKVRKLTTRKWDLMDEDDIL